MSRRPTSIPGRRLPTHGRFDVNAITAQRLKDVMAAAPRWAELHPAQKEALQMIAVKISRVVSGHPDFRDHWDDIAGYAQLASEVCGRSKRRRRR